MTVRIGFFGAGFIASHHASSLRSSGEDAEVRSVFDPDRSRAEAFALANGAAVADTEDEVLDACDAVYVCTWTSEHRRLVEAAADRRLAVFCEKPLSVDLEGAEAMTAAVSSAGVVNQVGLVLRHSPAFNLLRQLVQDPEAGRSMAVVFRDDQYLPVQGMYGSSWRADVTKAGAGTLLEHSIHDLDLLEWLLGPATSVTARSSCFHGLAGIDDAVAVTLGFANGAVGSLVSVWHDVLERPSLRRVEVHCERRWCVLEGDWNGPVRWITTGAEGGKGSLEGQGIVDAVFPDGQANADGNFVRAVAEGGVASPDFATALRAHVLADAVYRSAADPSGVVSVDA